MPRDASKLLDVRALAAENAQVEQDLPLAQIPDLPEVWAQKEGTVRVRARFDTVLDFVSASIELTTTLRAQCQRCLQPLVWPLTTHSETLFLDSEADADRAPPEWETLLAPGGRIAVRELVKEELLLALPIVPMHALESQCRSLGGAEPEAEAPVRSQPFANLGQLWRQGGGDKD